MSDQQGYEPLAKRGLADVAVDAVINGAITGAFAVGAGYVGAKVAQHTSQQQPPAPTAPPAPPAEPSK